METKFALHDREELEPAAFEAGRGFRWADTNMVNSTTAWHPPGYSAASAFPLSAGSRASVWYSRFGIISTV